MPWFSSHPVIPCGVCCGLSNLGGEGEAGVVLREPPAGGSTAGLLQGIVLRGGGGGGGRQAVGLSRDQERDTP